MPQFVGALGNKTAEIVSVMFKLDLYCNGQMNTVHITLIYITHFIILPHAYRSLKWHLPVNYSS
jgi:hypothetical protein